MKLSSLFQSNPEKLDALFELSPLAVCAIEMPTFRFLAANEAYANALRKPLPASEIVGKTVFEILQAPSSVALAGLERAHRCNEPSNFDTEVSKSLGCESLYISGTLVPVQRDGNRSVAVAVLSEVTEPGLLTRIFHELRTPLTSLKIATQLVTRNKAQLSGDQIEKNLKLIDEKAAALTSLINSWPSSLKWRRGGKANKGE